MVNDSGVQFNPKWGCGKFLPCLTTAFAARWDGDKFGWKEQYSLGADWTCGEISTVGDATRICMDCAAKRGWVW